MERDGEGKPEAAPFDLFAAVCDSVIGATRPLMFLKLEFPLLNSLEMLSPSEETMLMLELKFSELFVSKRLGFFGDGKNASERDLWRVRPRAVVGADSGSDADFGFDFTDVSSSSDLISGAGAGIGGCFRFFKNPSSKSILSSC